MIALEWKKVNNSRNQIKKAGKILAKGSVDIFEEIRAIEIVDNWRAAHAYPLQVVASNLRRREGLEEERLLLYNA